MKKSDLTLKDLEVGDIFVFHKHKPNTLILLSLDYKTREKCFVHLCGNFWTMPYNVYGKWMDRPVSKKVFVKDTLRHLSAGMPTQGFPLNM